MQIFITGGLGFIGSHLVEALCKDQKNRVIIYDNNYTGSVGNLNSFFNKNQISIIHGDILDFEKLLLASQRSDLVVHLAAETSVLESLILPDKTNQVNIQGSLNVFKAAEKNKIPKVIMASTSAVYGDYDSIYISESQGNSIISPYGVSKKTMEMYGEMLSKLSKTKFTALRFFNAFGPRQLLNGSYSAVIPIFIQKLLNKKNPIIFGDGLQTRDFIYVKNLVSSINLFIEKEWSWNFDVFNIGSGKSINLIDLTDELNSILDSKIPPIFEEARKGEIKNSGANIQKSISAIDAYNKYSLKEGLQETIEFYRNKI